MKNHSAKRGEPVQPGEPEQRDRARAAVRRPHHVRPGPETRDTIVLSADPGLRGAQRRGGDPVRGHQREAGPGEVRLQGGLRGMRARRRGLGRRAGQGKQGGRRGRESRVIEFK
ncbi:Hypothetical_protein [Hexamita inflata]|uniref:Hypothetical_protein n=1 Tax=Hexamita inflata TaxID=28002 RepID=A0ABP1I0X0_9EUKA